MILKFTKNFSKKHTNLKIKVMNDGFFFKNSLKKKTKTFINFWTIFCRCLMKIEVIKYKIYARAAKRGTASIRSIAVVVLTRFFCVLFVLNFWWRWNGNFMIVFIIFVDIGKISAGDLKRPKIEVKMRWFKFFKSLWDYLKTT